MSHINIEVKAKTRLAGEIREFLQSKGEFRGTDLQTDTYFHVSTGRLKLREGTIENNLIYYSRDNVPGPKQSNFDLLPVPDSTILKAILIKALGVKVVVKKSREIYYIDNVKFHLDTLEGLGTFIEIEASNLHSGVPAHKLREQCNSYIEALGIEEGDLIATSYSDMLLALEE